MDVIGVSSQRRRQLIDITSFVQEAVAASGVAEGLCHVFVPHTTAAVTLNENADPTVGQDLLEASEKTLPEVRWRHTEGNSDAHFLSTVIGVSVHIPISEGDLNLGRWQAVYFVELDGPRRREVWVTCLGT
ncbi:MAG TPA: secondary thiamine-phosphate synthase enzyme YjbQ [Thermoanaerobaculaceae bacterium]|nr:secondary thiamine-phosphate synthase enzyme YjbQ [Thermoanaerobaculaceae bacterium]HPS76821.1 secondary thiamine-phosphate synthase enzyme YjbQ [Thermoanaerobaculaceae bacterium]